MSISSSLSTGPRAFYHWIPPPDRALPFDPPPQTHSTEAFSNHHGHAVSHVCERCWRCAHTFGRGLAN